MHKNHVISAPFMRGGGAPRRGQGCHGRYNQTVLNHRDISLARRICGRGFTLGLGSFGGGNGSGGIRRGGTGGRGGWTVEVEVLGFVVLDGAKECAVVGGAPGGDLPQKKIDMARGRYRRSFRGVL